MTTSNNLRSIRVTFSDGDVVNTNMAAHLTDKEMLEYYRIGKTFALHHTNILRKVTSATITDGRTALQYPTPTHSAAPLPHGLEFGGKSE